MAHPSLQRRLNLGVGLGLAALLLVASVLLGAAVRLLAEQLVADRLQHDLETLIGASAVTAGGADAAFDRLPLIYQQAYSGHYYRIGAGAAVVRSRSLWDADFAVPALAAGERWRGRRPGPDNQTLLVLAQGVAAADGVRVVAVAEDIGPLDARLDRLTAAVAGGALLILALLLWLQRLLIRRSLRPLRRLLDELRAMERGERADLPTADVPREVLPLVERVNALLVLLAARLARSRKALGNLAHALKTPLAVLTQTADDLAATPAGRQLGEQVAQMRRTVDRELRRARLAGGGTLVQRFDLGAELAALIDTLQRIYRDKPVAVQLDCPPGARFAGDREDFVELMGVLLDNAFKWTRGRVRIAVGGAAALRIEIADDGPGIPPEQQARLVQRGQRLDEATAGAGLGLAIARDIVEQYDGELSLQRAALGGLAVILRLPGQGG